jgi:DNA gyrase subunit B
LYRIETSRGSKPRWAYSEEGKAAILQGLSPKEQGSAVVTRFKGLGEMMPEQLWETTMNPETR